MNTLHPVDALFLANAHLDAIRAAARAREVATAAETAAARDLSGGGGRSVTRGARRTMRATRNVRQNTSERPWEVFCPSI